MVCKYSSSRHAFHFGHHDRRLLDYKTSLSKNKLPIKDSLKVNFKAIVLFVTDTFDIHCRNRPIHPQNINDLEHIEVHKPVLHNRYRSNCIVDHGRRLLDSYPSHS